MSFEQSNYSNYNKDYCPTVYGAVFSNKNSEIDKTSLSFSMWQKTIKITIAPLIETIDGDVKVDYKGSIGAFLSPTKAYIFSNMKVTTCLNPLHTSLAIFLSLLRKIQRSIIIMVLLVVRH